MLACSSWTGLRQATLDARRLEEEAAEARDRADHHGAEVDRLSKAMDSAPPGDISLSPGRNERDT